MISKVNNNIKTNQKFSKIIKQKSLKIKQRILNKYLNYRNRKVINQF